MKTNALLSVVVPVHNEEDCLPRFHEELKSALASLDLRHEILFVDDGSTDGSVDVIDDIRKKDPSAAAVVLSRNFGHQTALTAGLEFAKGDAVVMLDADLQHPPALIPQLVDAWKNGAKVVHAVRTETEAAGPAKNWSSRLFYRVFLWLSNTHIRENAADFRLMDRQAIEALKSMKERHRFLRGMVGWLGFPEAAVPFKAPARAAGESKYTWRKMIRMAADAIFSFSTRPLRLALWLGLCVLAFNAFYAAYMLYVYFTYRTTVKGWPSVILLNMFLGSSQLIILGILGEYVGRIYEEAKERPLFVLRELRPHRLDSPR